jgi:hypothetical protein
MSMKTFGSGRKVTELHDAWPMMLVNAGTQRFGGCVKALQIHDETPEM